ncbi:hypothetical protein C8R48DRAFT_817347, partial [Suillus tomentosus]
MQRYLSRSSTFLFRMCLLLARGPELPSSTESLERLLHIMLMLGKLALRELALSIDTLIFPKDSVEVFILIFLSLKSHNLPPTKIPFLSIRTNSNLLSNPKSKKKDISARAQRPKSRASSVLSNLPPSRSFRNQVDQDVSVSFRIILFPMRLLSNSLIHPLIHILTQISFPVPGELSIQSHFSSAGYLPDHKSRQEMSPKHIAPSHCTIHSGLQPWCVSLTISSALTHAPRSESHHPQEPTAALQMPDSISSDPKVLVRRHVGSTTIYSFVYEKSSLKGTMSNDENGIRILSKRVVIKTEDGYGSVGESSTTELSKSSMKIAGFRLSICQKPRTGHQKMKSLLTISTILIDYLATLERLGSQRRTLFLLILILTSVSLGISQVTSYIWEKRKRRSISTHYETVRRAQRTFSMTCRSCTASSCTCHWYIREDGLISQVWKSCCGFVISVLSCLTDPLKLSQRTLSGGQTSYRASSSDGKSQDRSNCTTPKVFPTPALDSASASSSENSGERGYCTQVGQLLMERKKSDGLKQSDLSFSFDTLSPWIDRNNTFASTATIKESSKAGRMDAVVTPPSIKSLDAPSNSYPTYELHTLSIPHTSPASQTQRTVHPEESTAIPSYFSHSSPSPTLFAVSSMTHSTSHQRSHHNTESTISSARLLSNISISALSAPENDLDHNRGREPRNQRERSRFATPIVTTTHSTKPPPYKAGLTPMASSLRPHCLARDRLKLWRPIESRSFRSTDGSMLAITDEDLERVLTVMNSSWSQGTRESYGAGLLVFHVFCDARSIPEHERCP